MSRSIKKNGVMKRGRDYKGRRYNKVFRCRNKQQIRVGKDPYLMYELINPWSVHDEVHRWSQDAKGFQNKQRVYNRLTHRFEYRMYTDEEIQYWKRIYHQK